MQAELTQRARELRSAYVAIAPIGSSALATKQIVMSSSIYKQSLPGRGLALVYALPLAWDLPKLKSRANRRLRPVPLNVEHFSQFVDVLDKVATSTNGCYGVVLMGKGSRQGAGPTDREEVRESAVAWSLCDVRRLSEVSSQGRAQKPHNTANGFRDFFAPRSGG